MLPFYIFLPTVALLFAFSFIYIFIFFKKKEKGYHKPLFLIILMIFLIKILTEPYCIKINRVNLDTGKLKEPLKIAIMSDFHLRPLKSSWVVNTAAQKLKQMQPDMILLAGDYLFFNHADKYKQNLLDFKKFSDIAPTYAILGNHEYGIGDLERKFIYPDEHKIISADLEQAGIKILRDENLKITIKSQELRLVGFDEYWKPDTHPAKSLIGLNYNLLKIGLSHNPDIGYLPETKILDILVSGHTHGGQIRLPFIGSLGEAETLFPKRDYGKFVTNEGATKILNTSGLGESGLPIRFFDWPEIVELTIK